LLLLRPLKAILLRFEEELNVVRREAILPRFDEELKVVRREGEPELNVILETVDAVKDVNMLPPRVVVVVRLRGRWL